MTPRVAALISELRHQFYARFAAEMPIAVILNQKNPSTHQAIVSWLDQHGQTNYLYLYAHTAPDDLFPDRPLLLRASINQGADSLPTSRQRRTNQGQNETWWFNLTLLPEELQTFAPWIASLAESQALKPNIVVSEPPCPLTFRTGHQAASFEDAWTQAAWDYCQTAHVAGAS